MSYQEVIDNITNRIETIISERLPNTYQHITIEASDYNPSIDDTITVTITVTDSTDNPVTGWTVPLLVNGTSVSGLVTDSNGEVEYTYTCTDWGSVKFSVNSYTCFINVTGWKLRQSLKDDRVHVYENETMIKVDVNGQFPQIGTNQLVKITDINSAYAPPHNVVVPGHHYNDTPLVIDTNPALRVQNKTVGTTLTLTAIFYYDKS